MPLCALVCALAFSVSCNKDNADKIDWKEIPSEIITAESGNAVITVNEVPAKIGYAKISANSDNATLTLNNVIPGYRKVEMGIDLKSAGEGGMVFQRTDSSYGEPVDGDVVFGRSPSDNLRDFIRRQDYL